MKHSDIIRYQERLEYLFSQLVVLPENFELRSHWARYLCILVSGFLETSIHAIFSQYARETAAPHVANFVQRKLKEHRNPTMVEILELMRLFSPEWGTRLSKEIKEEFRDAVDSIVANSEKLAHGEDVEITYTRIYRYYQDAARLVELIEGLCTKDDLDLVYLRKLLVEYFSLEEVRDICFEIRVRYEDLPGETKNAKVRELVQYLYRRGQLQKLIAVAKRDRPCVAWPSTTT